MTEDRKQEIVDAIVAAFRSKGLRPCHGRYGDGEVEACAVGAVAGYPRRESFALKFGVPDNFTVGVVAGFDGQKERPDDLEIRDGWDVGWAVRRSVVKEPG